MYPELRTSVPPDEREHLVLESWKEQNIFRRSVEERDAARIFSFYEGPPTVNGTPGIHHVFSRTIKDAICRYKTMCGFRVERKAGWDTHGLPVEIAIEKELGFKHKREIEEYGIGKFNEKCKELVYSNISRDAGWRELTERMGYWVNMDDPYITCTNDYIESVWWAIKKFHDAGLIYKGFKIQPYCPRCETALSSHEVSLGYDTAKDPSVYVKFKRKNVAEEEFFLAWTTTPWTLLANVALAVHPDVEYVTVINRRKDKTERLVLAEALIGKLEGEVEIVDRKKGKELKDEQYEPLFDYLLQSEISKCLVFVRTLLNKIKSKTEIVVRNTVVINGEQQDVPLADFIMRSGSSDPLLIAEALLGRLGETEVVARTAGTDLEEVQYEPVFDFLLKNYHAYANALAQSFGSVISLEKSFRIVVDEYVTIADGTGIVHIAPAFGEDDYRVAMREYLPFYITVSSSGSIDLDSPYNGRFFKDADPDIMSALKIKGLLYRRETIEHTYPFCWRCDTALLYYAREAWYIRVTEYKQKLIDENQKINWQPPEIRDGRFGNWLEELKDWGLSRERFWGTPLPIWEKRNPGEPPQFSICAQICVGSHQDLTRKYNDVKVTLITPDLDFQGLGEAGSITHPKCIFKAFVRKEDDVLIALDEIGEDEFDFHKPFVDNIEFHDISDEKTGIILRRTPEVIDVWFDSGSMPFAQHHFMGETPKPANYPADYISEGVDQTRGWFYTMHAINTFLFGERAYKNVIVNDMLLDKKGQKMSKSKGNIVNPFDVMTKHGADATRWYLLSAAVPWKPRSFSEDDLGELERKLFGTLTNTYGFFALYANIDDYRRAQPTLIANRPEVDRWILSKLNSLVKECRENLDGYELTRPARAIQEFVMEQLSNWYIRRNRRRFWKGEQGPDKQAAYDTLYECLLTVSKLMAPLAPFFSDWLYQALSGAGDSVHLTLYPQVNESAIDAPLEKRMASAQVISSLVRQMRERAKIRVRQPLSRILIPVANRSEIAELRKVEEVIREEVNVKHVEYVESGDSDVIKLKAKANFKSLGAKLGKAMKVVAARVQKLSQEEVRAYQSTGSLLLEIDGAEVTLERGDIEIIAEDVEGWLVSSEGTMTVALDTAMTPALQSEGMAREFVNRVQNLRKDSGFDVTDRIGIFVTSDSQQILEAVRAHSDFIRQETLAETISENGASFDEAPSAQVDILDQTAVIRLVRMG